MQYMFLLYVEESLPEDRTKMPQKVEEPKEAEAGA